jgi:hypothetical protein
VVAPLLEIEDLRTRAGLSGVGPRPQRASQPWAGRNPARPMIIAYKLGATGKLPETVGG